MKRLKQIIANGKVKIEKCWQNLSIRKQRNCVLLFFVGYLLATCGVIATVWYDSKEAKLKESGTGNIRNPIAVEHMYSRDSITKKGNNYERR